LFSPTHPPPCGSGVQPSVLVVGNKKILWTPGALPSHFFPTFEQKTPPPTGYLVCVFFFFAFFFVGSCCFFLFFKLSFLECSPPPPPTHTPPTGGTSPPGCFCVTPNPQTKKPPAFPPYNPVAHHPPPPPPPHPAPTPAPQKTHPPPLWLLVFAAVSQKKTKIFKPESWAGGGGLHRKTLGRG